MPRRSADQLAYQRSRDRNGEPVAALRRAATRVTQTTSRGILYYAFPVPNPWITAFAGWSATTTTTVSTGRS